MHWYSQYDHGHTNVAKKRRCWDFDLQEFMMYQIEPFSQLAFPSASRVWKKCSCEMDTETREQQQYSAKHEGAISAHPDN